MIISRTPFRLSFLGGGSDYPTWYRRRGGSVLGCSINKYCYLTCRHLPPFFDHRLRIVYSKIENCLTLDEIQHPSARECLRYLQMYEGVEIHHDGDLPARGGIGSSSAFTVGLLHALHALQGSNLDKHTLALQAIHLEQEVMNEAVGSQDQVLTCYGGLNRVDFRPCGDIVVAPVKLGEGAVDRLNDHLLLFFTGIQRTASEVASSYLNTLLDQEIALEEIVGMVDAGLSHLQNENYRDFGRLLDRYWTLKRSLSERISGAEFDTLYQQALAEGAWGGKLVGAGGGGYLLLVAPPERHAGIKSRLSHLLSIPFKIEFAGSRIIFADQQEEYLSSSPLSTQRRS